MTASVSAPLPRLMAFESLFSRFVAGPAIVLMAFAAVYDRGLANFGLALLLLGFFIITPRYWRAFAHDPVVWISLLFLVWIPSSAAWLAEAYPDSSGIVSDSAQVWLKVFFLPALVTGFWLSRVPRLMVWIPLVFASGYFLRVVELIDWDLLLRLFLEGERAEFGLVSTHFGLYSLLALLGAVAGLRAGNGISYGWVRRAVYAYATTLGIVAAGGVVVAQTRSIWLASIVLVIGALILHFRYRQNGGVDRRRLWITVACLVLVLWASVFAFGGIVSARLNEQSETILKVLSLDFDGLGYNPIGYRIRAYAIGLQAWMDAPLLGNGPGIDRIRMLNTSDPEMRWIAHFHNEYLNVLATYGLAGGALFGVVLLAAARGVGCLFRDDKSRASVSVFVAASGGAIAVFSVFGQSLLSHNMPFVFALLVGIGLSAKRGYASDTVPGGVGFHGRIAGVSRTCLDSRGPE